MQDDSASAGAPSTLTEGSGRSDTPTLKKKARLNRGGGKGKGKDKNKLQFKCTTFLKVRDRIRLGSLTPWTFRLIRRFNNIYIQPYLSLEKFLSINYFSLQIKKYRYERLAKWYTYYIYRYFIAYAVLYQLSW